MTHKRAKSPDEIYKAASQEYRQKRHPSKPTEEEFDTIYDALVAALQHMGAKGIEKEKAGPAMVFILLSDFHHLAPAETSTWVDGMMKFFGGDRSLDTATLSDALSEALKSETP